MVKPPRRSVLSVVAASLTTGCVESLSEGSGSIVLTDYTVSGDKDVGSPVVNEIMESNSVVFDSVYHLQPCTGYLVSVSPESGVITGSGLTAEFETKQPDQGVRCDVQSQAKSMSIEFIFETLNAGVPIRVQTPNGDFEYETTGETNTKRF
jgi:hypothetical protein